LNFHLMYDLSCKNGDLMWYGYVRAEGHSMIRTRL
jgi:hypothetical protein